MIVRNVHPDESLAAETGTALAVDPPPAAPRDAALVAPPPRQSAHDRHFSTEHLTGDLKGRSVRGGAVTLAAQGIKFFLQMVQTVVLARLLAPEMFGLVAMVTAVTGFVSMFKDAGLSMATVQREHITHEQISTLFWINVALSAILAVLVAALAPALAWLYGDPRLTAITLVLAGTFVLSGLAIQHQALLRRQMRFTDLATIQIITMATGVTAAITAAVLGAGYWALVAMAIVQSVVGTGLVWGMCRWVPGLPRRGSGVRGMLAFGGNLTGFSVVNYFARQGDNVLIGWAWGASTLGHYSRAYSLIMFPIQQFNAPISQVAIPLLSRLQDAPERYRRAYLTIVEKLLVATTPLAIVLALTADWLVEFLLGPKWDEAAAIFSWLAVALLYQPFTNTIGWLFVSQNRTSEMFRWGIFGGSLSVASFFIGLPWGAVGVAASYSLCGLVIQFPLLLWWIGRRGPIAISDLYSVLKLPVYLAAFVLPSGLVFRVYVVANVWEPLPALLGTAAIALCVTVLALLSTKNGRRVVADSIKLIANAVKKDGMLMASPSRGVCVQESP